MLEPVVALEPAPRLVRGGQREAAQWAPQRPAEGAGEGQQQAQMQPPREQAPSVEQRQRQEQAGDAHRGPQRGPQALPQQRRPGQLNAALERPLEQRGQGSHEAHAMPRERWRPGPVSHGGMVSLASSSS